MNGDLGKQYRLGKFSALQFWQNAKKFWNIQESTAALSLLWCSSYRPIDESVRMVDRLRNIGHELLYLSDNTGERVDYLDQKYRFLQKFDGGIFSYIVGRKKPDPVIYQLLLDKSSNPAASCIFIDDKPEHLEPAKKLGMAVIAYENPNQLESSLKKLTLI